MLEAAAFLSAAPAPRLGMPGAGGLRAARWLGPTFSFVGGTWSAHSLPCFAAAGFARGGAEVRGDARARAEAREFGLRRGASGGGGGAGRAGGDGTAHRRLADADLLVLVLLAAEQELGADAALDLGREERGGGRRGGEGGCDVRGEFGPGAGRRRR